MQADMVTYGKTLGGGLPVGAIAGKRELMKRFREDKPADVCLARGTFNSHPYVMGAMHAFLKRLESAQYSAMYDGLDERWNARADSLNKRLADAGVAGAGRQFVVHLDGALHAAFALQLDASVLPARRGSGAELGGHRPLHLQPELLRCGLRRGRRQIPVGDAGDAGGWLVVGRPRAHQQGDQASRVARASSSLP